MESLNRQGLGADLAGDVKQGNVWDKRNRIAAQNRSLEVQIADLVAKLWW